jgi:dephospho-CoA kinase
VLLVGLTGGIGAGKSTVAGLLADRGAVIVDADTIARQVVKPGTPALAQLVDRFGEEILLSNGTLNRPALAARVFGDPEALQDLNAITHPAIRDRMASEAAVHAGTDSVVILDIPLLKEETRDQFGIVGVIVVDVSLEVAVERLLGRGLSEQDARARIASQMSREERRAMAGIVIDNSGSRADLEASVGRVWEWIEGLRSPARSGGVRTISAAPPAGRFHATSPTARPAPG